MAANATHNQLRLGAVPGQKPRAMGNANHALLKTCQDTAFNSLEVVVVVCVSVVWVPPRGSFDVRPVCTTSGMLGL